MLQYTTDYDEVYPSGTITIPSPSGHGYLTWQGEIMPYLGIKTTYDAGGWPNMPSVFVCPDDQIPFTQTGNQYGTGVAYALPDNGSGGTYTWECHGNANIACGGMYGYNNNGTMTAYDAAHVPKPDSTLMLVEYPSVYNGFQYGNFQVSGPFTNLSNYTGTTWGSCMGATNTQDAGVVNNTPYHSGGWNYGFVDGHVKWLNPITTIGTKSASSIPTEGAYCYYGHPAPFGMWSVMH